MTDKQIKKYLKGIVKNDKYSARGRSASFVLSSYRNPKHFFENIEQYSKEVCKSQLCDWCFNAIQLAKELGIELKDAKL